MRRTQASEDARGSVRFFVRDKTMAGCWSRAGVWVVL